MMSNGYCCYQEIDAHMEKEMLKKKELEDLIQRQKEEERDRLALQQKYNLQNQMEMKAQLRAEAY